MVCEMAVILSKGRWAKSTWGLIHYSLVIPYTVWCRYNAVNFLTNIHKKHRIARPLGICGFIIWLIFCHSSCDYLCNIFQYHTALLWHSTVVHKTWSTLVWAMVSHLTGPSHNLNQSWQTSQSKHYKHIPVKFYWNIQTFHSRKCIWKLQPLCSGLSGWYV